MQLVYLTPFLLAVMCCGCGSPTSFASDPQELERLKGTWQVIAIEAAGKPLPPDRVQVANVQYVFDGDRITIKRPGRPDIVSTFSVDAASNPKRMIVSQTAPARGIYAIEGTKLRLCIGVDEKPSTAFPADFVSRASPKIDLITMERRAAGIPVPGAAALPAIPAPVAVPGVSMYLYSQSTGKLTLNDQLVCVGYSGRGAAKNDHAKQAEKDGPIPVGEYMLTGFRDDDKLGAKIMGLLPVAGKSNVFNRFPRETFALIADSGNPPSGCLIFVARDVLEKLIPFNAKLQVVK